MKSKKITGTVTYQNLATGFWGIIDDQGNEWLPVNMPDSLKEDGKKVSLTIREAGGGISVFMWGTPIEVVKVHS